MRKRTSCPFSSIRTSSCRDKCSNSNRSSRSSRFSSPSRRLRPRTARYAVTTITTSTATATASSSAGTLRALPIKASSLSVKCLKYSLRIDARAPRVTTNSAIRAVALSKTQNQELLSTMRVPNLKLTLTLNKHHPNISPIQTAIKVVSLNPMLYPTTNLI